MKRAGDWAMLDARGSSAATRAVVPTTKVSDTVTSRLSPPADGRSGSRYDNGSRSRHLNAAAASCDAASPIKEQTDPRTRPHRGVRRLPGGARPHSTNRHFPIVGHAETLDGPFVRAPADDRPLALRDGVAGTRRDRHAGVRLEPMRLVSRSARLLVRRLEFLRNSAGEPMPELVAWPSVDDAVRPGQVADRLCGLEVRVAVAGAVVPAGARLVLNGAGA